jgi:ABC-2 type transport system ATP-binding protein
VSGHDLTQLATELAGRDGITMVAPFGANLHVSGPDAQALEAAIAPYRADPALDWQHAEPSLEDVFIDLMARSTGRRQ